MNEDKLRKAVKTGSAAQGMISGDKIDKLTFKEAVDKLREQLMTAWATSTSTENRERIWISVNLLEKVADTLGTMASNGRLAQSDLDRLLVSKQ